LKQFHSITFFSERGKEYLFYKKEILKEEKKSKIPRTLNESFAITFLNAGTKNGKKVFVFQV
jgi:hypothetical protein